MSEYRLFKVIRTDEQKYFDIEYVRDVVMCGECKVYDLECEWCSGLGLEMKADDFCSYGEPKEELNGSERLVKGSERSSE